MSHIMSITPKRQAVDISRISFSFPLFQILPTTKEAVAPIQRAMRG